eukprot:TRINITY_DN70007_c0_g1_i1.p1 TRINITY_DN70007_c0_g1~~TRINITY_DN70007_c0_g1_i1.p1  ORF type:complete len:573 (+),score=161.90 TRINITY_DN70007_c0_g1_i1:92-1810(+)
MSKDILKNQVLLPTKVKAYLEQHQLDAQMTAALNDILKTMPADPLGYVAGVLAEKCFSAPRLAGLRPDLRQPLGQLRFDILATVKGARVRIGSVAFGDVLFTPLPKEDPVDIDGDPPDETAEAEEDEKVREEVQEPLSVVAMQKGMVQEREWELVKFLQQFFEKSFVGASVEEFTAFPTRCAGLSAAKAPEGLRVDVQKASSALLSALLEACSASLDMTSMEFLQYALAKAMPPGCQESCSAPPLRHLGDMPAFRSHWPSFAFPAFHGGGPGSLRVASARICITAKPAFVGGALTEESTFADQCPTAGWVTSAVRVAVAGLGEAAKVLASDKASAACVVEGVPYSHPAGLVQTIRLARKAGEQAAGAGGVSETKGLLVANADEAWLEEEGVYEVETGKKLSLQELVDLYVLAAEDDWLQMIVRPFRPEDMATGSELLREQRPDVRCVASAAADGEEPLKAPAGPTPEAYSAAMDLNGETLSQFVNRGPSWRVGGHGLGRLLRLSTSTAKSMATAVEVALALPDTEVILLEADATEEDFVPLAAAADSLLNVLRARPVPEDAPPPTSEGEEDA